MYETIYNAQPTASKRRCHFTLFSNTTGQPITPMPTLTGVKAYLSKDGAALAASTNDVVALGTNAPGACYVELTTAELTAFVSGTIIGCVKDAAGAQPESIQVSVVTYDPDATAAPDVNLVSVRGYPLIGDGTTTPFHA
jgi:hypothetical protein